MLMLLRAFPDPADQSGGLIGLGRVAITPRVGCRDVADYQMRNC